MKKINRLSKIFLYLSLLSGILWMGSYLTRLFISYRLFEAEGLALKSNITPESLEGILFTLLPAVTATFILYIIFIASFVLFLIASKISLKKNGWLFITALIIFVTLPFEVYLMWAIDWDLISILNSGAINANAAVALIKERITVLSSFPLIELFSYFAIVYFILFQPLTSAEKA